MGVLDELTQQNDQTFAAHKGDVLTELAYKPGDIRTRPAGNYSITRPDVQPASQRLGIAESFKQGLVDDMPTKLRLAAQAMFPNDPNAISRFGVINGRMVFVNDQGKLENVQGGPIDWLSGVLSSAGPATAGAIIGAPGGPGGAALGAAAGEAYRKVAASVLFGEPQTVGGNVLAMGGQAAAAAAGELLGKGVAALRGRRAIKGLDDLNLGEANTQRAAIRNATGIELDLAQVTNNPKLKALKLWARNFPGEASEIVKANDDLIAGQVDDAIQTVVNTVSRETDVAAAGIKGINAAQAAIDTAKAQVAAKAGPLYRQAFAEGGTVNTAPIIDALRTEVASAKGSQQSALKRALNLFFVREGTKSIPDTTIEGLHATKLALDEMLERRGTTALGRVTRRQVVQLKNELVDAIAQASPTYDAARQTFAAETARLVDPLENSVVGVLAKVQKTSAASAAAKIFNEGNVTPEMIRSARTAIQSVESANPDFAGAWNGLVRQWLTRNFVRASKELQTGTKLNVAGKFRQALLGTETQKAAMKEALGPEAEPLFNTVMDALQQVSRTPTASSATEFNRLITEEVSPGGSIIRGLLSPKQTVIGGIQQRVLEMNAKRIAEALTDPAKVSQLKALQGISDAEKRALVAAGIIGVMSVGDAGNSLLFPPNTQIPPALLQEQP